MPTDFERQRIKTIEMLNPEFLGEMRDCAESLNMEFEEFLDHLHAAYNDEGYYEGVGDNESYRSYDWNKIWLGYELLTGKKVDLAKWGYARIPFSCAC